MARRALAIRGDVPTGALRVAGDREVAGHGPRPVAASTGTARRRRPTLAIVLGAVDDAADSVFERTRGNRVADTTASVLSNLADYGLVWVLLAAVKARRPGGRRQRAVEALAISGVSSAVVNTSVKRAVGRQRPDGALRLGHDDLLPVRAPSSASFPSGHTLAAFSTAVLLPESAAETTALLGLAAAVAASRVHLQAHHASDVVGGAAIGILLGVVGRRALRHRHPVPSRRADRVPQWRTPA